MYIIYPIEKDTYITNKLLNDTDGRHANFGKASTLDLFKTYNENINLKSKCILRLNDSIFQSSEDIIFENYSNSIINLYIDIDTLFTDNINGTLQNNKWVICINSLITIDEINEHIKNTITDISSVIGINAYFCHDLLMFEQKEKGEKGDKILELQNNSNFSIVRNFSRVEESVLLLKSDLGKNNDFFSYDIVKDNIKIYLDLHDITTSLSKPKDYNIEVLPLSKDFNEGLGRDVYSLTDIDAANWIYANYNGNTNEKISWESAGEIGLVEGMVADSCDLIWTYNDYDFKDLCNFYVKNGNENILVDITSIYEKYWEDNSTLENKGLCVKFANINLNDDETYFAKRLGSKNVRNRHLKPSLKILIDDNTYNIPINKLFYFNEQNKIFLYNKKGGTLKNIQKIQNGNIVDINPTSDLSLNITSIDKINNIPIYFNEDIQCDQMTDIKGQNLKGTYFTNWNISSLNQSNILNLLLQKEYLEFKFDWYNNGTLIYSDIQKVYKDTLSTINSFKRLRASVKLYSPDLGVMNDIHKIAVTFFDLDAQYDFVKVKRSLQGLDIGDVFYEVIDYDTNEVLIPMTEEMNATKCLKENDYYWFPFFNSDVFYGRRIQFIFKLKQQEQNNLIVNANEVFRVGNNG